MGGRGSAGGNSKSSAVSKATGGKTMRESRAVKEEPRNPLRAFKIKTPTGDVSGAQMTDVMSSISNNLKSFKEGDVLQIKRSPMYRMDNYVATGRGTFRHNGEEITSAALKSRLQDNSGAPSYVPDMINISRGSSIGYWEIRRRK